MLAILAALIVGPPVLAFILQRRYGAGSLHQSALQFDPPDGLSAAEMAATWKAQESLLPRTLAAVLLDLAARGQMVVSNADGLTLNRVPNATGVLKEWESELLDQMFSGTPTVKLGADHRRIGRLWSAQYSELVGAAETSGRRNSGGERLTRMLTRIFLIVVPSFGVALFFVGAVQKSSDLMLTSAVIVLGSAMGGFFARFVPLRVETSQSSSFLIRTLGFQRALQQKPSAVREQFVQRQGLQSGAAFAKVLPYALVLSQESSWVRAFPELTLDQLRTSGVELSSVSELERVISGLRLAAWRAVVEPGYTGTPAWGMPWRFVYGRNEGYGDIRGI